MIQTQTKSFHFERRRAGGRMHKLLILLNVSEGLFEAIHGARHSGKQIVKVLVMHQKCFFVHVVVMARHGCCIGDDVSHSLPKAQHFIDGLAIAQLKDREVSCKLRHGLNSGQVKWHLIWTSSAQLFMRESAFFHFFYGNLAIAGDRKRDFDRCLALKSVVPTLKVERYQCAGENRYSGSHGLYPTGKVTTTCGLELRVENQRKNSDSCEGQQTYHQQELRCHYERFHDLHFFSPGERRVSYCGVRRV